MTTLRLITANLDYSRGWKNLRIKKKLELIAYGDFFIEFKEHHTKRGDDSIFEITRNHERPKFIITYASGRVEKEVSFDFNAFLVYLDKYTISRSLIDSIEVFEKQCKGDVSKDQLLRLSRFLEVVGGQYISSADIFEKFREEISYHAAPNNDGIVLIDMDSVYKNLSELELQQGGSQALNNFTNTLAEVYETFIKFKENEYGAIPALLKKYNFHD